MHENQKGAVDKLTAMLLAFGFFLANANLTWAVTPVEIDKLLAADGAPGDTFGSRVAIDGDTVLIGAGLDDDVPLSSGSAYVFVRNTAGDVCAETQTVDPWCQQQKLTADDAESGEWFGYQVALFGDTAAITALRDDDGSDDGTGYRAGSVYIFVRSGTVWSQQAKLRADDFSDNAWFGSSVAIFGDTVVVGARNEDENGIDAGAAYVFVRGGAVPPPPPPVPQKPISVSRDLNESAAVSSWTQEAKVLASDGSFQDLFGISAALTGDLFLIGANRHDGNGVDSGAAYLFERNVNGQPCPYTMTADPWCEQAVLTADDGAAGDLFGHVVALHESTALIGAPGGGSGAYPGSAYVFGETRGVWSQIDKLTADDGFVDDGYAFSVGLTGQSALITADTDDDNGFETGSTYIFTRSAAGWNQQSKFYSSDVVDWFGAGVAYRGDTAVIGALNIFDSMGLGSAYIFEFDFDEDGTRDELDNCPYDANVDQSDTNANNVGDVCDIGATQTFSDNGTPAIGDCLDRSTCLGNGWGYLQGSVFPDAGEAGVGDSALLYDNGGGAGYHFMTWDGWDTGDTRFFGDIISAGVTGFSFRARHSGVGDPVVLRAYVFNYNDGRDDGALSSASVTIANTDMTWQTYSFSVTPSDFEAYAFDALNPRSVTETLSGVSQFGLRHDPGFTGPKIPVRIDAAVFFDDLVLNYDADGDGFDDDVDNCPAVANPSQRDLNGDGRGDSCSIRGDQNRDGRSDILLRNIVTGANQLYVMDGSTISQNVAVPLVQSAWEAVGRGDYNGDGKSDILWRYTPTGALWIYLMDGSNLSASVFVGTISDANWKIVGNGDYNGDGKSDILWRHAVSGTVWLYEMDSNTIIAGSGIGVVPNLSWTVVGSGDYDGDGNSDILWRNVVTGTNWMYLMNGATISTSVGISTTPDLGWDIVASGDYNGDGNDDILWRHSTSGTNWMYLMNGTAIATSASISVLPDPNWIVVGDGDHNGDGKADVLWRNLATGSNWMYLMDGLSITDSAGVSTVTDQNWQIIGTR